MCGGTNYLHQWFQILWNHPCYSIIWEPYFTLLECILLKILMFPLSRRDKNILLKAKMLQEMLLGGLEAWLFVYNFVYLKYSITLGFKSKRHLSIFRFSYCFSLLFIYSVSRSWIDINVAEKKITIVQTKMRWQFTE